MGSGVNLIPMQMQIKRRDRRLARRGLVVTAVYLTLLLGGTLGYLGMTTARSASAVAEQPEIELAVGTELVARLQRQVTQTRTQWIETARRVEGSRVLSERPDWGTLLRLLGQSAGPDVVLGNVVIDTTGPTITAGAEVEIGGVATDPWNVSAFVLRLESSGLFDKVTILSSRREPYGNTTATAFALQCLLYSADDAGVKP